MKTKDIIQEVKAFRGDIFATIIGVNDLHYVKLVKKDLLDMLSKVADDELEFRVFRGEGYIARAY